MAARVARLARRGPKTPEHRPGQEGGKRALNRQKRIADIQKAGLKLFLEKGIASVSIDDIAKASKMAKGNFYRYFDDKRALIDSVLHEPAGEVRRTMRRCAIALAKAKSDTALAAAYTELAAGLAMIAMNHLDVMRLYLQENRAPATAETSGLRALADELNAGAIQLTEVAIEHGLLRVKNASVSGLAVVGSVEQLAIAMLRGELDVPPAEVAQIVVNMVLHGITK